MTMQNPFGFTAPVRSADLRLVLSQHSAASHDHHQLVYSTGFGERRTIQWLTKADAHRRAQILRRRGYTVAVSTMAV